MSRTCKHCKERYEPISSNMIVCSMGCSIAYMKTLRLRKEKKEGVVRRRKIKAMKDKIKTLSDHKKELQILVNRFVNLRDLGLKCVSCDTPDIGIKRDASHFFSQGGNPSVRFDLDNLHSSCVHCNRDLHGNLLEYRPRLIKKIGRKRFDALEQRRSQPNKQSIPEIENLKQLFKLKIKNHEKI